MSATGRDEPRPGPTASCRPALRVEGLGKSFGSLRVLRGIDASVQPGSLTAFIGPNGAGKTTLFHAISGDLFPDTGRVHLGDRDVTGLPTWKLARLGLGRLFQDVRVFRALSCHDNLLLPLLDHEARWPWATLRAPRGKGGGETDLRAAVRRTLATVGLEEKCDDPAGALSFGSQKLLALARLLAGRFRILLLDEPASGISPHVLEKVGAILRVLVREQGLTVAMIEHNMRFVAEHADFTYVMRDGEIFDGGPTAEVLARPANRELCLGM